MAKKNKKTSEFMFGNNEQDDSETEDEGEIYKYPIEKNTYNKESYKKFGPYGTQWIHDKQHDDEIDVKAQKYTTTLEKLLQIEFPPQRSEKWRELRFGKATASDMGTILNLNSYEPPYGFLTKKVLDPPFESNMFCYHGTKYEHIATMIYQYRMNVEVKDFGLIAHPKYNFLAASPDGIIGKYKLDGKSLTKYVGRMLEIKCPVSRKIKTSGEIFGEICPKYYWAQVQLQLECCDLNDCDFWQCDIREYEDREDFIKDTDLNEPFRSKFTGMEKGCLIQMIPKDGDISEKKYLKTIYECSKCIYPPKIEMSPLECDIWIAETMSNFNTKYKDYKFDKIIYWRIIKSHCVLIKRDKKWFNEKLPEIEKMWNYVLYLRKNKEKSKIFFDYVEYIENELNNKKMINDKICEFIDFLYNEPNENNVKKVKEYSSKLSQMQKEINNYKIKKEESKIESSDDD